VGRVFAYGLFGVLLVGAGVCAQATSGSQGIVLYVATDGNDAWSGKFPAPTRGKKDGPFATLERARDAIRALKRTASLPPGGATVFVRGGDYRLKSSLRLTEEDSGTESAPVVYAPYRDEPVRLLGGRILTRWNPVRNQAVLKRLDPEARKHVVACDLAASGISDLGAFRSRGFGRPATPAHLELFFQGRRMTVARWPNQEFTKITGIGDAVPKDDGHGGKLGGLEQGFQYAGDRPRRWQSTEDVWVHGYWAWDWANSYEQVASIDASNHLVKTLPPYGQYGFRVGQRFYFLNVLEELDEPGEYYLERKTGTLYFWPPAPVKSAEAAVSLLEEPLIDLQDARYVTIRGFTLEYGRSHGIQVSGASGIRILGCTICNLGNYGVVVRGGRGNTVAGCDIYHTGDGGIELSGGDRRTLSSAGHAALNNHIHHIAEWSRTYNPAIRLSGVGQHAANNLIHDGPHTAIQLSGNEHVIELNEIHHVCLETGDVGAFYMGRDFTERGNIVRHNFFHHTDGVGMGSMGVYLDDCASGTTVFGNVFYKVTRAAFIGGGRNNLVENNIFVDCEPAVQIDGRGLSPQPVWHNMIYHTMQQLLEDVHYHEPPYRARYPELLQLETYFRDGKGVPPEGNQVRRNIVEGKNTRDGSWLKIGWYADPKLVDVTNNLTGEDPHFVNEAGMNFQLRDDSPAYRLGFQRIPFEKIGIQLDANRKR